MLSAALAPATLILRAQGFIDEARAMHETELAAWRRVRGERHPETLTSMGNPAGCLARLGHLDEVRAPGERVAAVLEEADQLTQRLAIMDRDRIVIEDPLEEEKSELHGDAITLELGPDADPARGRELLGQMAVADGVAQDGQVLRAHTADGAATASRLFDALDAAGIRVMAVSKARPTLDDVYVRHAGRSISGISAYLQRAFYIGRVVNPWRLLRTRRYQPIDGGRFIRAVWPPGRRWLTAQAMLSAMAQRLGLRDGVLIADRMAGGGFTGSHHVAIGLIRAGSEEDTVRQLTRHAEDLGYELANPPGMTWKYRGVTGVSRFLRSDVMPNPEFATVAPGGSVYGILVPPGATGLLVDVGEGYTMTDGGYHSLNTLNAGAVTRMAQLSVDVAPPPTWRRFWFWWWIRGWHRRRLAWAAWRLGAFRGRVLGNWFIGGDAVGPYSFGVATLTQGDGRQFIARISARADALGFATGHGLARPTESPAVTPIARMVVSAITYPPGAKLSDSTEPVPPGFTGLVVTVTTIRSTLEAGEARTAGGSNPPSRPDAST